MALSTMCSITISSKLVERGKTSWPSSLMSLSTFIFRAQLVANITTTKNSVKYWRIYAFYSFTTRGRWLADFSALYSKIQRHQVHKGRFTRMRDGDKAYLGSIIASLPRKSLTILLILQSHFQVTMNRSVSF